MATCPECHGGKQTQETCLHCQGTGIEITHDKHGNEIQRDCRYCKGGLIFRKCRRCKGTGQVK